MSLECGLLLRGCAQGQSRNRPDDDVLETLRARDPATLAHLFFHLHFFFVQRSGEWIHDGTL